MADVHGFACRVKDRPEWSESFYNTTTAGKARYEHYLNVTEPYPDIRLIDIRVRKLPSLHRSETFAHVARMRGMPDTRPGDRITSAHGDGMIVDAGSGANFVIVFDTGKYAGRRLTLHPLEFTRLTPGKGDKHG